MEDWKYEIANDSTRFGYKYWLRIQSQMIRDGDLDIPAQETAEDG